MLCVRDVVMYCVFCALRLQLLYVVALARLGALLFRQWSVRDVVVCCVLCAGP